MPRLCWIDLSVSEGTLLASRQVLPTGQNSGDAAIQGSVENEDFVCTFRQGRVGREGIEYGLIAAGIAVTIITAVNAVGTDLSGLFGRISGKLTAAGT
jgi:pilus assembly protein Flp/PilA